MPLSLVATPATMSYALNATTWDIFASIVNGMFVQYAKSIALAILNNAAPWVVLSLVIPPPPLCLHPNLIWSLSHVPNG